MPENTALHRNKILKRAFAELALEEFEPYKNSDSHTFSDQFEKKINTLTHAQKRSYWKYVNTIGKRVAAVIIAIAVIASSAMTVEAIRVPVVDFIKQVYQKCTDFIFNRAESEAPAPESIETVYCLSSVPTGFEVVFEFSDSLYSSTAWGNEDGDIIELSQQILGSLNAVDSEGAILEEVKINGADGFLYKKESRGILIWATHEYTFTLIYEGVGLDSFDFVEAASNLTPVTTE